MAGVAVERGAGNLPAEMTSFVGRRQELAEVRQRLETARLVTLTGVGGVGKTRLALRVAADTRRSFADGTWFVDLSPVQEADLLAQTVTDALGIRDQSARESVDVLVDHLADRRMLLVLDTCEHLVDPCAMLAEVLLRAAPNLYILATSRQPLDVPGEHTIAISPLDLSGSESLFAARAAAVLPDFAVSVQNRENVVRLCHRLDGLPLAIELAAGRLRALSVEQIVERLDDRFQITRARRTQLPRHQTLRAAVGWSHELCTPEERLLWARLSVFAGDFDMAAAEHVCADDDLPGESVFELVAGLVEKSIVVRDPLAARYRMLDTIREYGAEWLDELGQSAAVRLRHRDWFAGLAVRAATELATEAQGEWFHRLHREHANLRAAMDYALSSKDEGAALRIVAALGQFWIPQGMLHEGRHWLGRALAEDAGSGADRAMTLYTAAAVALLQGDVDAAQPLLAEGQALGGDTDVMAYGTQIQGFAAFWTGDLGRACELLETATKQHREAGNRDIFALLNDSFMAVACCFTGDFDRALARCTSALDACAVVGERWCMSHTLWIRGLVHWLQGQLPEAQADARNCLRIKRDLDDPLGVTSALDLLGACAMSAGELQRAARLAGVTDTARRSQGASMLGSQIVALREAGEAQIREALGDDSFEAEYAAGALLPLDEVVAQELGEPRERPARPAPPGWEPLTRREREIAELVAGGLSNREIADQLVIAKRTVDSHLEHILAKLGFNSRAQIAAWVAERA